MNNKIIPLMTSGRDQVEVDTVNNSAKNIEFINLGEIYCYKLESDTTIITKTGKVLEGKSGDIVVKSHCRSLYYIDSTGAFEELLRLKEDNNKEKTKTNSENTMRNFSRIVAEITEERLETPDIQPDTKPECCSEASC